MQVFTKYYVSFCVPELDAARAVSAGPGLRSRHPLSLGFPVISPALHIPAGGKTEPKGAQRRGARAPAGLVRSWSQGTWLSHPFPSPRTRSSLGSLTRSAEVTRLLKAPQTCVRVGMCSSPSAGSLRSIHCRILAAPAGLGTPSCLPAPAFAPRNREKRQRGLKKTTAKPSPTCTQLDIYMQAPVKNQSWVLKWD